MPTIICPHCYNHDEDKIFRIYNIRNYPDCYDRNISYYKCEECSVEWKEQYDLVLRIKTKLH
jgi:hypothetical protein